MPLNSTLVPRAASKLVKNVFSTLDQLEQFPKFGRKLPELKNSRYRETIVGPCRIFYREDQEIVNIIYVMRSERKLRKYLLETREIENS